MDNPSASWWFSRCSENLKLMLQWDDANKPDFFSYEKELLVARLNDWQRELDTSTATPDQHEQLPLVAP